MRGYLRFVAMILTSMVAMFAVMYANTYDWDHVQWSETRFFMTLLMGSTMTVIMLSFMHGMYRDRRVNVAILVGAGLLFVLGIWLVRSQETVQEQSYMRGMIPHHSIAILTSERAAIDDIRVCELAVSIIEAQRREIEEMEWLIEDIEANGPALTDEEADLRAVPEFEGTSPRDC